MRPRIRASGPADAGGGSWQRTPSAIAGPPVPTGRRPENTATGARGRRFLIRLMSEPAAAAGRHLGPLGVTDGGRGPKEIVVAKGEGAPEAASDAVLRESFRDGSIVNGPFNPGIGK